MVERLLFSVDIITTNHIFFTIEIIPKPERIDAFAYCKQTAVQRGEEMGEVWDGGLQNGGS